MPEQFDVFLCYKTEGRATADALREALEAQPYELSVFQDYIKGGLAEPLQESIFTALDNSKMLLALITPEFTASPHCRAEIHTALLASYYLDSGSTKRVMAIPHGVDPDDVSPKQLSAYRLRSDGTPDSELLDTVKAIADAQSTRFGDAPAIPDPQWHPQGSVGDRRFSGRYAELWHLHKVLRAQNANGDRGLPVAAIHGMGGQGKTALCMQYARLFQRDHPGGVFIIELGGSGPGPTAEDFVIENRYQAQLDEIARSLGAADRDELPARLREDGRPYLWIVDDVPASASPELVQRLLAPTEGGRTLLTTRRSGSLVASGELRLGALDSMSALAILTRYRAPEGDDEVHAAAAIADLLGELPLGLTIAAGLTRHARFDGYASLLEGLADVDKEWLEVAREFKDDLPQRSVIPFTSVLLRSLASLGTDAQELLYAASVLAPSPIPRTLLEGMVRAAPEYGPNWETLVGAGEERGLIDLVDGAVLMHAQVARALRNRAVTVPGRRTRLRDAALETITAAMESTRERYGHARYLGYLPHVRAVAGLMLGGDRWGLGGDEANMVNESARTGVEAGETRQVVAMLDRFLELAEGFATEDPIGHAALLNVLAIAHEQIGLLTVAMAEKRRVHEALARRLGADHPATVTLLQNIGSSHFGLEEFPEAHRIWSEVYRYRREHPGIGPEDRSTRIVLNDLARARRKIGATPEDRRRALLVARRLAQAADLQWSRFSMEDDKYRSDPLEVLTLVAWELGDREEAADFAGRLHEQRLRTLGTDHPETLDAVEYRLKILGEQRGELHDTFQSLLLARLRSQGAGDVGALTTVYGLVRSELDAGPGRESDPTGLPEDLDPGAVRLDGDQADLETELIVAAAALQQQRVDRYDSDDPRTCVATAYLAYGLAVADHLDGQIEQAVLLIEDAYGGVTDAAAADDARLGPHDLETVRIMHEWITGPDVHGPS